MKKSELFCLLDGKKFSLNSNNYATVMSILEASGLRWADGITTSDYVSYHFERDGECCIYIHDELTTYPNVIMHSDCECGRIEDEYQLVDIDKLLIQYGYTSDDIDINISIGEILI